MCVANHTRHLSSSDRHRGNGAISPPTHPGIRLGALPGSAAASLGFVPQPVPDSSGSRPGGRSRRFRRTYCGGTGSRPSSVPGCCSSTVFRPAHAVGQKPLLVTGSPSPPGSRWREEPGEVAQSTTGTSVGPGTETGAARKAGETQTARDFRTRQRGAVRRWKSGPGAHRDLGDGLSAGLFLDMHSRSAGRARSTQRAAGSQHHSRALLPRVSLAALPRVGTSGMGWQRRQATRSKARSQRIGIGLRRRVHEPRATGRYHCLPHPSSLATVFCVGRRHPYRTTRTLKKSVTPSRTIEASPKRGAGG